MHDPARAEAAAPGAADLRPHAAEAVAAECTRLLYAHGRTSVLVSVLVAVLVAWILRDQAPPATVAGWLGAVVLIAGLRGWLGRRFSQARPGPDEHAAWRRRFEAGVAGTGLCLGLAPAVFASHASAQSILLVLLALVGMMIGAVTTLGSVWRSFAIHTATVLVPVCLWIPTHAPEPAGLVGLVAVFGAAMLLVARRHGRALVDSMSLAHANAGLAERLAAAHAGAEAANLRLQAEVRERGEMAAALRESEARLRLTVESAMDAMVVVDDADRVVEWSTRATEMFGWSGTAIVGRRLVDTVIPERHRDTHREGFRRLVESGGGDVLGRRIEVTGLRLDGEEFPLEVSIAPLRYAGALAFSAFLRDISERRRAERLYECEKRVLEAMADNADLPDILAALVDGIETILPGTLGSVLLLDARAGCLRHGAAPSLPAEYNALVDGLAIGPDAGSCGAAAHSGRQAIVHDTLSDPRWAAYREEARRFDLRACWSTPIVAAGGQVLGTFALYYREPRSPGAWDLEVMRRLTHIARIAIERAAAGDRLRHQATHDSLTGLVNRREFERRLEEAIAEAGREGRAHAVCFLDLDQFKVLNDTCGHGAGDELLRRLGARLAETAGPDDTLARLGGDEFGLLVRDCTLDEARSRAVALTGLLGDFTFAWDEKPFRIGVSIGVVPVSASSGDLGTVMAAADAACYAAKERGRNRVHVYLEDDVDLARRRTEMRWVSRIQGALDDGRFRLMAQPIMGLGGDGPAAPHYEVLVRMVTRDGQTEPPGAFLPAAERYNLSSRLDRWVVQNTLDWLAAHPAHLAGLGLCCVNLSGPTVGDGAFLEHVLGLLEGSGVAPDKICFEVTETAAVLDFGRAARFIDTLRSRGCRFALDDFGSGVSSFAYLKRLPVDFVKIDGLFVRGLAEDRLDHAMVRSINDVAHAMGMRTVAEFVENDAILARLRDLGVDYAQGYGIARPCPIEALVGWTRGGAQALPPTG